VIMKIGPKISIFEGCTVYAVYDIVTSEIS